ncbi:MAG: cellulase family glycosylhydrolase [bacterium]
MKYFLLRFLPALCFVLIIGGCNTNRNTVIIKPPASAVSNTNANPTANVNITVVAKSTTLNSTTTPIAKTIDKYDLWSKGVKLRGANIYQRRVYPDLDGNSFGPGLVGPVYTQKDFDGLSALGANWVQIEHPGLYSEKPPYRLDGEVQINLDNLISMASKANMFVTIAFRTGPGRSEFTFYDEDDDDWFDDSYRNDKVWKDETAQQAWADMWEYTAERYKNNPIVVGYNLMVEPNGESRAFSEELWEPDEFYPKYKNSMADWNQMYPKLVSAIRKNDKNTPILVGHMAYNSVNWLPYLNDVNGSKIVWIAHQYEPYAYTHDAQSNTKYPSTFKWYGEKIILDKNYLKTIYDLAKNTATKNSRPLAIDEFGVYRFKEGASQFLEDSMNLMEERGTNYCIWSWDSAQRAKNFPEDDQFDFTRGANKKNHEPVQNPLLDVVKKYWQKNSARPF